MEKHGILKTISDEEWERLRCAILEYGKNQTLHEMGSECKGLDCILEGGCCAYTLSHNGTENVIFEFHAGDVIGSNLLFGPKGRYPMSLYCTADTKILHLKKDVVEELLRQNPDFMMAYISDMAFHAKKLIQRLTMCTQKSLRVNIIEYLELLAKEQRSRVVHLPMTKKQLAEYFSVQRPSLFRELKNMREEGLIEINNRQITLFFERSNEENS